MLILFYGMQVASGTLSRGALDADFNDTVSSSPVFTRVEAPKSQLNSTWDDASNRTLENQLSWRSSISDAQLSASVSSEALSTGSDDTSILFIEAVICELSPSQVVGILDRKTAPIMRQMIANISRYLIKRHGHKYLIGYLFGLCVSGSSPLLISELYSEIHRVIDSLKHCNPDTHLVLIQTLDVLNSRRIPSRSPVVATYDVFSRDMSRDTHQSEAEQTAPPASTLEQGTWCNIA